MAKKSDSSQTTPPKQITNPESGRKKIDLIIQLLKRHRNDIECLVIAMEAVPEKTLTVPRDNGGYAHGLCFSIDIDVPWTSDSDEDLSIHKTCHAKGLAMTLLQKLNGPNSPFGF